MNKQYNLADKQQYLRDKILNAGYDAEKFVQFCSERHDLDDLENWSMHELVQIVRTFIQSLHPPALQQHATKEEFGYFQTIAASTSAPAKSNAHPVSDNKLGLVFSDDDWNALLTGPSIVAQVETQIMQQAPHQQYPSIQLDVGLLQQPAEQKIELSSKDSPLSPPSSIQRNQPEVEEKPYPQILLIGIEKPAESIKLQKPEKKSSGNENNNPINLSNVRLKTAKEKALPPLPMINDVTVLKTEQVARNFLQSDYTLYHINFSPCQHVIQRKFADLRRARNVLQRLYPFLRLPYLEPQGWISSSEGKDNETLFKYRWMVEEFMKYIIIKSEQLKNCELVRILCGFSPKNEKIDVSKDELKKKLDAYQYVQRPKFIGEVVLADNSIIIPPVSNGERVVNNTVNLLTELDLLYQKLRKQFDLLFVNYDLLAKSFLDVASTFESLENLIKKYNMDNNEAKEVRIFEGLKEMTSKLAHRNNEQYMIFKMKIKNLFRYEKDNMNTLKDVIEYRNKVHYEYSRQGLPGFTSNSMKIQGSCVDIQSSIPLEEPIRNNKNTLAVQEIFWSYMSTRQISRYWEHLRRKIGEQLTLIAYDELDSENQNLNFWNIMIKKCVI